MACAFESIIIVSVSIAFYRAEQFAYGLQEDYGID